MFIIFLKYFLRVTRLTRAWWDDRTEKDCACVTSDPVVETVGAKISTWATHSEWKTLESLDFAIKFQLVFRKETVVFRRYVLALLLVVLLRNFEAYLVYLSLIWGKLPRRFSCFKKFGHFSCMFPGFPTRISDTRNRFSALSEVRHYYLPAADHLMTYNHYHMGREGNWTGLCDLHLYTFTPGEYKWSFNFTGTSQSLQSEFFFTWINNQLVIPINNKPSNTFI